jgi:hypothetical protein
VLSLKKLLKVFIGCWTTNETHDSFYHSSSFGHPIFNFEAFQVYNREKDDSQLSHIKLVKDSILRIIKSLFSRFREQCMHTFLEVWYSECHYQVYPPENCKMPGSTNSY